MRDSTFRNFFEVPIPKSQDSSTKYHGKTTNQLNEVEINQNAVNIITNSTGSLQRTNESQHHDFQAALKQGQSGQIAT
ncbi:unnamed protein product [Schistosoma margrebowiei]|uniref:Uncharacterized protein n=1 Tax=Schistosoma margrebowiei TaxID=48269 RepID=A0A183MJ72_9TREM|nr:unnamed protein product [Schistosoma margrebowiei]